jgi:hypothetical protein
MYTKRILPLMVMAALIGTTTPELASAVSGLGSDAKICASCSGEASLSNCQNCCSEYCSATATHTSCQKECETKFPPSPKKGWWPWSK